MGRKEVLKMPKNISHPLEMIKRDKVEKVPNLEIDRVPNPVYLMY